MRIVGLIPARGGSKGIPRKNVTQLAGRSLIEWSISAATKAKSIDDVFVSTEDPEIASVSAASGATVIPRPNELSSDVSSTDGVIAHAIDYLAEQAIPVTHICLLQPTSPLRSDNHIDEAVAVLQNRQSDCVISVYEPRHPIMKAYRQLPDGTISGLFSQRAPYTPRQCLPKAFLPNGAIYLFTVNSFRSHARIPRKNITPYVMSEKDSVDIDCNEDLNQAEQILLRRLNG